MKRFFFIVSVFSFLIFLSSCNRKIVSSATGNGSNFDQAAFDFYFVEAIHQKLGGNYGDALKLLEQCLKINPASDGSYFQMSQIMIASGDLNKAKGFILKALNLDQRNFWYLMTISALYYEQKNIDSAQVWYEKAAHYYPLNEEILNNLIAVYAERNQYSKISSLFKDIESKRELSETMNFKLIKSLIYEGKYDDALSRTLTVKEQTPEDTEILTLLGQIYLKKNEKEKAEKIFNDIKSDKILSGEGLLNICNIYLEEKDYPQFFKYLNLVLIDDKITLESKVQLSSGLIENEDIIKSNYKDLLLSLMIFEANYKNDNLIVLLRPQLMINYGDYKGASEILEQITKTNTTNYYAWEKLLIAYLQMHDYKSLMTTGEKVATDFNMSFLAKILYANGALETGNYDIASEELKKAEILAGDNAEMKLQIETMRADLYYRKGDFSRAYSYFDEALKLNSGDLTVMNNYAYYLAEQNSNLRYAEELAKKVIDKEKENVTYLDTYAWVLFKRGKTREACNVMEKIMLMAEKDDAELYEHYGFILEKMKRFGDAVSNWKKAIMLDSGKTYLNKKIEDCTK